MVRRVIEKKEVVLVRKGIEVEMELIESGKVRAIPLEKIRAKYKK